MDSQIDNDTETSKHDPQFLFGCMMWHITQEQLLVVVELVCIARSSLCDNEKIEREREYV